jgi:hypothetical protein
MDKEVFKNRLKKEFPLLYSGLGKGWKEGGMLEFNIGEGWQGLILELSAKLENIIEKLPGEKPYAVQVKEKFAGLRFYMSEGTEEIFEIIHKAEIDSLKICECCGDAGGTHTRTLSYWVKTLCDRCIADWESKDLVLAHGDFIRKNVGEK